MTRAEQAALKAYPAHDGASEQWKKAHLSSLSEYIQGYKQAEKDLALTKDDVWCIFNLVRELQTKYPATEGCLQEVADIFNEQREKK